MLDSAFEVSQRGLALVGVGHRQHDFDARILRHPLRRSHDKARRAGLDRRPRRIADDQQTVRGQNLSHVAAGQIGCKLLRAPSVGAQ